MNTIGLDIGTTSVCGICYNAETGAILQTVREPNQSFLLSSNSWEKQQDAVALVQKVRFIADQLLRTNRDVASIGITGQMHGIVYLSGSGEPISPLTIWQDKRGDLPYIDGKSYAEWLSDLTGYTLATGYGTVTHFYNVVNSLVPEGAETFCTIHDLAAMALTGRRRPLLHPSDAASLGIFNLCSGSFDTAAIEKAGMDISLFPQVQNGYGLAGTTPEGIPVSVAIGDNQASVLGSLSDLKNSLLINVGTGSQISCVIPGFLNYPGLECRPLVEDLYLLNGSSLCGGRAYAILEHFLCDVVSHVTGKPIDNAYSSMDALMTKAPLSSNGLLVETTFSGTRQHPDKRGSMTGIGIDNLTMANVCAAFMNGMTQELHDMYLTMQPYLAEKPSQMVGSGNGIRQNSTLASRFSSAFNLPLRIPAHNEEAAFGAALFSLVAAGFYSNIHQAQKLIRYC